MTLQPFRPAVGAAALAVLFALNLFGVPRFRSDGGYEPAARHLDQLLAEHRYTEALPAARESQRRWPDEPLADRQLARTFAGLKRADDEAEAWLQFLRRSPVVGDACARLSELGRSLPVRCLAGPESQTTPR